MRKKGLKRINFSLHNHLFVALMGGLSRQECIAMIVGRRWLMKILFGTGLSKNT